MFQPIQRWFGFLLFIGVVLNALGLYLPLMESDSTLYAAISKQIILRNNWLSLYAHGEDWLDKPHLPFWLTAISFKLFGVSAFTYKLPAFICWLLGLRYTFITTQLLYNKSVAYISTLIYVIALHAVLANYDVRAEAYLTFFVIAATYYVLKLYEKPSYKLAILTSFFIACAILTKGIFLLIPCLSGVFVLMVKQKKWQLFKSPYWYAVGVFTFIFILPELYSLYQQFDLHPNKLVFGSTHVSGIKFFLWDSQFGRFFNNGPIKGSGDMFFYLHTTLWAFLPYSIILVLAIIHFIKTSYIKNERSILYASMAITFLVFSFSKFQLPHYIVILFPHFSILCAAYLYKMFENNKLNTLTIIIQVQFVVIAAALIYLFWLIKLNYFYLFTTLTILLVSTIFIFKFKHKLLHLIAASFATVIAIYIFLFAFFYPTILPYQSELKAAEIINKTNSTNSSIGMFGSNNYTIDYLCSNKNVRVVNITSIDSLQQFVKQGNGLVFTNQETIKLLWDKKMKVNVLGSFNDYHVSMLSLDFLNAKTRANSLSKKCLLQVSF